MSKRKTKVLALNVYAMGHSTFGDSLEKFFAENETDVEFHLVRLSKQQHALDAKIIWRLSKLRLPGVGGGDADYFRYRAELGNSFLAARCLDAELKKYTPDVLYIHTQHIALLSVHWFKKIPTVISLDCTSELLAKERGTGRTFKPIIELERKCFEAARYVAPWSHWAAASVVRDYGIASEKVTAIHPPIPIDWLKVPGRAPALPGVERARLLFVGNDFKRKGGEELLEVFREHFQEKAELHIVSGAEIDLQGTKNVYVHRGVKALSAELAELYQKADVFVLPTKEECFGLVFMEAMAAGLPCVGTDVMAVPEMVRDGETGLLVGAGNKNELKNAIEKLIDDAELRRRMAENARKVIDEEFNYEKNCREFERVFRACSGNS